MEENLHEPLVLHIDHDPTDLTTESPYIPAPNIGLQGNVEEKPSAAFHPPHVHPDLPKSSPYSIPQYDATHYKKSTSSGPLDVMNNPRMNIVVSGLYTIASILMTIHGFGIMTKAGLDHFLLGMYSMAFGVIAIMYDLRCVIGPITIETWFPFLGNYFGRGCTILFFGLLSCISRFHWWGFVLFDILIFGLYMILYFVSNSMQSTSTTNVYTDL